jgi:hypothetical protein
VKIVGGCALAAVAGLLMTGCSTSPAVTGVTISAEYTALVALHQQIIRDYAAAGYVFGQSNRQIDTAQRQAANTLAVKICTDATHLAYPDHPDDAAQSWISDNCDPSSGAYNGKAW